MIADPAGDFTEAIGMINPGTKAWEPLFGHKLSKRFSMVIKDNIVQTINIDEAKIKSTLADVALMQIEDL